jgi:hypothetical protein
MTAPPTSVTWIPDYLFGSLRHWRVPVSSFRPEEPYRGSQAIHCVRRWQHLVDSLLGRPPRARCGAVLAQPAASALFEDGAPLCAVCAARAHAPADQFEVFNHRGRYHRALATADDHAS